MHHLNPGDKAPNFESKDNNDESITLDQYKGSKVALYFYPHDMTPTCTTQACNLRDNYASLSKHNIQIVGVSEDPVKKHQKFIDKYELPFPLIADEDHSVHKLYGVWGLKKFMGKEYDGTHRTTFLIDEEGMIVDIILKVKAKEHTTQIIEGFDK